MAACRGMFRNTGTGIITTLIFASHMGSLAAQEVDLARYVDRPIHELTDLPKGNGTMALTKAVLGAWAGDDFGRFMDLSADYELSLFMCIAKKGDDPTSRMISAREIGRICQNEVVAAKKNPRRESGTSLVDRLQIGTWGVGDASECRPSKGSKKYRLERTDGRVVWTNGTGDTDTERIVSSSRDELTTVTERSVRSSGRGQNVGTRWAYRSDGSDRVRVSRQGGTDFVLVKCP